MTNEPEVVVNDVTEPIETAEPKKTRKPREKVRDVEELYNLPVKKLSDKEKDKLIDFLKETVQTLQTQRDMFSDNAKSAYEKVNNIEDQYKAMEAYYRKLLKYIDTQVEAFHTAVNQATRGGIQ
jgi:hypothetical protein